MIYVTLFGSIETLAATEDFNTIENESIFNLDNEGQNTTYDSEESTIDNSHKSDEMVEGVEEVDALLERDDVDSTETVDIATVENNLTYEGQWATSTEQEQHTFFVDFSGMDKAALCLVRTGLNNTEVTLYDSNNKVVSKLTTSDHQAKNWFYIARPSTDSSIFEYSIIVKPLKYTKKKSSSYRIMVGDKNKAESLMGEIENAVELDTYYESEGNFQSATYLPNQVSYYYKIVNWGSNNILTILLKNNNIRFRLWDDNNNIVLDSNDSDVSKSVHKTRFIGNAWSCAEKVDLSNLLNGKGPYYIEIYNLNKSTSSELISTNFLTAFGNPVMCYKSTKIMPGRTITINSNRYTESTFNVSDSNIPQTAKVDSISYSGTAGSSIQYFRAMPPGGTWGNGSSFSPGISFSYKKVSKLNYDVHGEWRVAYRASSSSRNNRITPYYTI